MRQVFLALTLSMALVGCQGNEGPDSSAATKVSGSDVELHFSPNGGCTEAVVRTLGEARQTVFVQAYSFTSAPIAKAVVDAQRRGVKVQVILDKSNETEKYSAADFLAHAGVPVLIDDKHEIAHNKIMIIDGETVITGSFNFTKAAEEHNAENLLVIHSRELAARYEKNYQEHLAHSIKYERRDQGG